MFNLVEYFNDHDLRWFLNLKEDEEFPENYDTEYLIPISDTIIFEYEKLEGDDFYTRFLRKSDIGNKEPAKLLALRWSYEILLCDPSKLIEVQETLLGFKIKVDSIESVDREFKLLTQRLQVKAMKDAKKHNDKASFGAMCADIKNRLPNSAPQNATVAEFVRYKNIIKKMDAK